MPWIWRSDGDYVRDLPPIRRIIPFIMRGKNEAIAYFQYKLDVSRTEDFIEKFRQSTGKKITYLHLAIFGAIQALARKPKLNRFVAGKRIFQRRGIWISLSAKKAKEEDAPIVTVKRLFTPEQSLGEIFDTVQEAVELSRSGKKTATDKEMQFLLRLPFFLLSLVVRFQRMLDHFGLLPASFIRNDPLYASLFIANLGSIQVDAAFHHLYEYGNIPIFLVMGRAQEEVVVGAQRQPEVRKLLPICISLDERITDAFYGIRALEIFRQIFEHPQEHISIPTSQEKGSSDKGTSYDQ